MQTGTGQPLSSETDSRRHSEVRPVRTHPQVYGNLWFAPDTPVQSATLFHRHRYTPEYHT